MDRFSKLKAFFGGQEEPQGLQEAPQMRQGSGVEQPIEDYKKMDEIKKMYDEASGMANVAGMAKMAPAAISAAEALMVAKASPFGKVAMVPDKSEIYKNIVNRFGKVGVISK